MSIQFKSEKYNDKYDVTTCVIDKKKYYSLIDIIRAEELDNISMNNIFSIPIKHIKHVPKVTENNTLTHMRFLDKPGINLLKKKLKEK